MAHVEDRWTAPNPEQPNKRLRTPRWGTGLRYLATWHDRAGKRRTKSFSTKPAALSHLGKVEHEIATGTDLAGGDITLSVYGRRWIDAQLHQRPATRESLEIHWSKRIRPDLGGMRLQDIRRQDVQDAVVRWTEAGLSAGYVEICYGYLAAMLKAAVQDGMIRQSPAQRIALRRVERRRVTPITTAEVLAIANAAEDWVRPMVLLAAATGMRSGELRGLTVDRITWTPAGASILVDRQLVGSPPVFGPLKRDSSERRIQIDQQTADMLRRHIAARPGHLGLVFTGMRGEPWNRRGMAGAWRRITAGILPPARSKWHQLRHFHASLLIADGQSPRAVADRLGHADPAETLRTYSHLWPTDEARAVASTAAALWPTDELASRRERLQSD